MRATVDLDDPSEFEVLKAWNRLAGYGDGDVHGRVSSSGRGVHLKVHSVDPEQVDLVRAVCGDDTRRRAFDAGSTLKPKQILFSSKPSGATAGEWTTDREALLAAYRRRAPATVRYPEHPTAGRQ